MLLWWHLCSNAFWILLRCFNSFLYLETPEPSWASAWPHHSLMPVEVRCHRQRMHHKLGRRTAITKVLKLVHPIIADHLSVVSQRSFHSMKSCKSNTSSTERQIDKNPWFVNSLLIHVSFSRIITKYHQCFAQSTVRSRCFTLCCTAVVPRPRGAPLAIAQPTGAQHNWSTKTRPETLHKSTQIYRQLDTLCIADYDMLTVKTKTVAGQNLGCLNHPQVFKFCQLAGHLQWAVPNEDGLGLGIETCSKNVSEASVVGQQSGVPNSCIFVPCSSPWQKCRAERAEWNQVENAGDERLCWFSAGWAWGKITGKWRDPEVRETPAEVEKSNWSICRSVNLTWLKPKPRIQDSNSGADCNFNQRHELGHIKFYQCTSLRAHSNATNQPKSNRDIYGSRSWTGLKILPRHSRHFVSV